MNMDILMKIKDTFDSEFSQIMETGIKRYKNHQVLINKQFDKYYHQLKCIELSDNNSELQDSFSSEG